MTETDNAELAGAIRAGCTAADVHLTCSYPSCTCKQIPAAVEAALRRPAPRVSEEQIAQAICHGDRKNRMHCGQTGGDPDPCADGCKAPWRNHVHMGRDKMARAVLSLLAGEAPGPPDPLLAAFKPMVDVNDELKLTMAVWEDVANVARPLFPNTFHWIDVLHAMDDGRPVGLQIWMTTPPRGQPAPAEAQEPTSARLMKASDAVKDDVCGILCPSVWETDKGPPPHHDKCVELRAALSEAIDEQSYADLRASGGLPERVEPQPPVTPDTAGARDFAKFLDGDQFTAPLRTALTEVRVWAEAAAATSANHITTLASQVEKLTAEKVTAAQSWQCFHCDGIFTDHTSAEEHFGTRQYDAPLCVADQFELTSTRKERDEYAAIRATLLANLAKAREALGVLIAATQNLIDSWYPDVSQTDAREAAREAVTNAHAALTGAKP